MLYRECKLVTLQGYPQRMRLQRGLYGINTVVIIYSFHFIHYSFLSLANHKISLLDYSQGRRLNLTLELSYLKVLGPVSHGNVIVKCDHVVLQPSLLT